MNRIYFEDLEELVKQNEVRETKHSRELTKDFCVKYARLFGDLADSHTSADYNKSHGYKDIFIPGLALPALCEVWYRRHYPYAVHIIRDLSLKIIKPLYPGDRILVREDFADLAKDKRLIFDNSSPVFCKRRIFNQNNELTGFFNIGYLIKRKG